MMGAKKTSNSQKVTFHKAKIEDIPILTQLMTKAYDTLTIQYLGKKSGPPGYSSTATHEYWMKSAIYYKIVYNNQYIIGGFIITIQHDVLYLNILFIDPKFQNMGVGTKVVQFIEQIDKNIAFIKLNTPKWALQNHYFYEKLGYKRVDEIYDSELGFDLYIYMKTLSE
ncbi:MAG: GNAT family N-acetyltransferase [Promethearchaeota archaeon]